MTDRSLAKNPPARDEDYLDFIRSRRCCVELGDSCKRHEVIPHHFGKTGKGKGQKCSDYETVPLCTNHHLLVHHKGRSWFYEKYRIDFYRVMRHLKGMYDAERRKDV